MKTNIKGNLLAVAVSLISSNVLAAEHWLCAGSYDKAMPDGSVVEMWGYADVSDTNTHPNHTCPNNGNTAYTSPGPQLDIPVGDVSLTIHLTNKLLEPTSLVIPGQTQSAMMPVMDGNRVRSFTHEVISNGSSDYTWNNLRPGSYVYQTGTHPAKQVQMGLFGGMIKDQAVNTAYPGVSYNAELIQFYSEIDPILHERVKDGFYGLPCADAGEQKANPCTSTIGYNPKWFLVNGEVFIDPSPNSPTTLAAGAIGSNTLIRFFNMGLRSHSMVLQGAQMKIVAEDGHTLPVRHDQYSLMIAAGKTHDALFTPSSTGVFPLYERMHNVSVADAQGNLKAGGLMSFLEVSGGNVAPVAANDSFAGIEDGPAITGNVMANDSDGSVPAQTLVAELVSGPPGFSLNPDGNFSFIPTANFNGTISFTYRVNDGEATNNLSNVATATMAIAAVNDEPTITSTPSSDATQDVAYNGIVTASDVDVNDEPAQTLTYSLVTAPAGMTINATTGSLAWLPTNNQVGVHNITVRVADSATPALTDEDTFSVTVVNVNDAPSLNVIANQNVVVGSAFNLTAVGSDIDVGDTISYTLSSNPVTPWLTINSTTGAITGTPTAGDVGVKTVTVTVNDSSGAVNNSASRTFTLNVNTAVVPPVIYFSIFGNNANPPGVTGAADDADIYSWNGTIFSRIADVTTLGVPAAANADEIKVVDASHFYVSFANDTVLTNPVGGTTLTVQDEDIAYFNNGTWSVYFDGTGAGLTSATNTTVAAARDIDAFDIAGSTIYFSTQGDSLPPGVAGAVDNSDIYAWNGTAFSRKVDVTTIGVPAAANVDGLKYVDATHFYLSFEADTTLPGIGLVQDEDIVYYSGGTWTVFLDGTAAGLTSATPAISGALDIDGFDMNPVP